MAKRNLAQVFSEKEKQRKKLVDQERIGELITYINRDFLQKKDYEESNSLLIERVDVLEADSDYYHPHLEWMNYEDE